LLQSQLDTLEMPEADERVVSLDIVTPLPEMVSRVMSSVR
jgi:gluconate kinase